MVNATAQARALSVATGAGILIRYGFYFAGLLVFGLVAVGMVWVLRWQPTLLREQPAFHIADSDLARIPMTSEIIAGGSVGRSEALQYGQIYQHDRDLTVIMVQPPDGRPMARDFAHELAGIPILRKVRARLNPAFYDLQTRFGLVRAAEMQVDVDGRRKLCLAFLSRFDTPYMYLKGWLCDASGAKPAAGQLACLLNRLTLDKPLASADADAFVRPALARNASCYATPVSQTTDTRPYRRPVRRY